MSGYRIALACGAIGGLLLGTGTALAKPSVRITSISIVAADTRKPVRPPFHRNRAYSYVVRYQIGGARSLRVLRRAEIRAGQGLVTGRVRPPWVIAEPGRYFATGRIPVGPRDPRATYVLRYTVAVTANRRTVRTTRVVRMPFR